MMCGGFAAGVQVASGNVRSRSVTVASDSIYPCASHAEMAATPERENFDT